MKLRPYQQSAVDAIFDAWESSDSTLAVMPTGTGKTVVLANVIKRRPGGRAMLLAHREELIWQGASKIEAVTGIAPDVEMAEMRARNDLFHRKDVVVSSIQTQNSGMGGKGRMTNFDPLEFSMLIVDEAHHAVAPSYRKVIDYYRQNPTLKILGVTATPDRADELALGQVFGSAAFDYELVDAINDGWLVPIKQQAVVVDGLDYSSVRNGIDGDLSAADLERVLVAEEALHRIANPTYALAAGRKALVFAASQAHAEKLTGILNRYRQGCADWICDKTPKEERRKLLDRYRQSKFQFLVNVDIATEGFDVPDIQVVVMARPTKSRAKYAQMVGRGTRPLPGLVDAFDDAGQRRDAIAGSGKPWVEVIDFVGNSGKHRLVCTADLLGGKYEEAVIVAAAKKAQAAGGPVDMAEALAEAQRELEEEKAREAARRAKITLAAHYRIQEVDPFEVFNVKRDRERGWDVGREPTPKMLALLEKQGVPTKGMNFTHAKQLIGEITGRWDSHKCSFKQARLLKRYGYAADVSFEEAKRLIDGLAQNGWRRPDRRPVKVY